MSRRAHRRIPGVPPDRRRRTFRLLSFLFPPLLTASLLYLPDGRLESFRGSLGGVRITDRRGELLYRIPGPAGSFEERLAWPEVPSSVIHAIVRLEDRRFFRHRGVDPLAIARAAAANLRRGKVVSGASTITMQLARLIAPHGGGVAGKIGEALYALRLETRLSKREILLLYLNGLPFGYNTRGFGAASWRYFDRPLSELSRAEVLLLATVPKAPARHDPFASPGGRALLVAAARGLAPLVDVEPAQVEAAANRLRYGRPGLEAPHFVRRVAADLKRLPPAPGGQLVAVRTSLDLGLQRRLTALLLDRLSAHRQADSARGSPGRRRPAVLRNAAALVVDNRSGQVLAWVGSPEFSDAASAGEIDAVAVASSSGSTLKPFLYALALEKGYTAASLLPDLEVAFGAEESYRPENFDRRSRGPVRLRTALASSLNVPSVYLLSRLGLGQFLDTCRAAGLSLPADAAARYGLGAAIGNAEVSLEQLVPAFSVFPNRGLLRPARTLISTLGSEGRVLAVESAAPARVFQERTAWLVADILADEAARVGGFGLASHFDTGFPALFKSGTASGYASLWCLGATAQHTVGVWAGNLDGRPAFGLTGSSLPADVAVRVLAELQTQQAAASPGSSAPPGGLPPQPSGLGSPVEPPPLERRLICTLSGAAASPACPAVRTEYFLEGTAPLTECPVHAGGMSLEELAVLSFLGNDPGPRILFPRDGSLFYRDASLGSSRQEIRGWVVSRPGQPVKLLLDGRPFPAAGDGTVLLPVKPGRYRLEALGGGAAGGGDAVSYTVR